MKIRIKALDVQIVNSIRRGDFMPHNLTAEKILSRINFIFLFWPILECLPFRKLYTKKNLRAIKRNEPKLPLFFKPPYTWPGVIIVLLGILVHFFRKSAMTTKKPRFGLTFFF